MLFDFSIERRVYSILDPTLHECEKGAPPSLQRAPLSNSNLPLPLPMPANAFFYKICAEKLVKYHAWPLPKKEITCVQSQKGMKKMTDLINKVKLRKMGEKGLPCAPHQLSHLIDIIGGAVQQEKAIKNFFTEILLEFFPSSHPKGI